LAQLRTFLSLNSSVLPLLFWTLVTLMFKI
jgi:hypothetical protein